MQHGKPFLPADVLTLNLASVAFVEAVGGIVRTFSQHPKRGRLRRRLRMCCQVSKSSSSMGSS